MTPGLKTAIENHHYLTSLDPQSPRGKPQALLDLARRHWEIENRLHHVKDRSLGEDADRTRNGAANMARIRSLAVALLAQIPGQSVPQKQIGVSANPNVALRLLKRKRLSRTRTRL